MSENHIKTMTVGIVQMQSLALNVDENLKVASEYINKVANEGAKLVVLPEMFNVGFYLGEKLLSVAEELTNSLTINWLKEQAITHNIYIMTCIYEKYQNDFYNTMVLVTDDGDWQYYRKRNPTVSEWTVWRRSGEPGPGIFETPLGRIGGVTCFDSFTQETFEGFKQSAVDMVVISACWGNFASLPTRPDIQLGRSFLGRWSELASEVVPQQYSEQLQVPTIFVNQGGTVEIPVVSPRFSPFPDIKSVPYHFRGRSSIRDAHGKILAQAITNEADFYAVKPVQIVTKEIYPPIKRVDIPMNYMDRKYFFVVPPFLGRLYQAWSAWGFDKTYRAYRDKYTGCEEET